MLQQKTGTVEDISCSENAVNPRRLPLRRCFKIQDICIARIALKNGGF